MRKTSIFLIICACLQLFCGCAVNDPVIPDLPPEPVIPDVPQPPAVKDEIQELLDSMTQRERIGQLFIVRPEALGAGSAVTDATRLAMEEYPVGGVAIFAQNILSPDQLLDFNASLQDASKIPLFISVDEEGGLVARLANHKTFDLPRYKNAAAVGSSGNADDAYDMGTTIGTYLKKYGFNLNFAPVADVNTNPQNPVIGTRAFASDPMMASQMAKAMANGLNEQGVIATFKHFPGHGDTAQDSHLGLAVSNKSLEELRACEFVPFMNLRDTDCVMVGHIALPNVTGDNTPASFSRKIVTDILKNELGFDGLVITDSLEMGAVTKQYGTGEAAVLALEAGCHIVLMPLDFEEAFSAVESALTDGRLTQDWLDETVYQILAFKKENGIL